MARPVVLDISLARWRERTGAQGAAAIRHEKYYSQIIADGAHDVIVDPSLVAAAELGPFDLILESVSGKALATALTMLSRRRLRFLREFLRAGAG